MATGQFNEVLGIIGGEQWLPSDGSGVAKTIYDASTGSVRLDKLTAESSDTAPRVFIVEVVNGATTRKLATVTVPAGSGEGTTAPLDILNQLFGSTYHYLVLPFGWKLNMINVTTLTAATEINIYAEGGTL